MSTVIGSTALSQINQSPASSSAANKQSSEELRTNFMTLLTTQLRNQDPTKPLENAELTSQLAQINTVSGIEELNKTVSGITGQMNAGQHLQATALIGHGVLVPGNRVLVGDGETTPFGVELAKGAENVNIEVYNAAGEKVRSFDLGAMQAGVQSFSWDGKLADGSVAADGAYTVKLSAMTGGAEQSVTALNYGLVNGVSKAADGSSRIDLGGTMGQVSLADIRQVI
jgi:flagellar basal-body rod modification protein FlgD